MGFSGRLGLTWLFGSAGPFDSTEEAVFVGRLAGRCVMSAVGRTVPVGEMPAGLGAPQAG